LTTVAEDHNEQRRFPEYRMKVFATILPRSKLRTSLIALLIFSLPLFVEIAQSSAAPVRVAYSSISGAMGPL
jgi:hypothetical protein